MEVEIVGSELVAPLDPPPHPPSLWTSNLDLVILNAYIKTVYFFPPHDSLSLSLPDHHHHHHHHHQQQQHHEIPRLKRALASALSHFWPMAGRLSHDASGRLQIDCNDAGALLVEARCPRAMDALPGGFTPNPNLLSLVPMLDPTADLAAQPLVIIQVTKFRCGGTAVGVGIEHHVADGKSAVKFLNTWADISRGVPFTDHVYFDRKCLQARTPPTPEFNHDEYLSLPLPPNYSEKAAAALPSAQLGMGKRKHSLNAFDDASNGHHVSNGRKANGHLNTANCSATSNHVTASPLVSNHDYDADDECVIESEEEEEEEEEAGEANGHHKDTHSRRVVGGIDQVSTSRDDESIVEMFEISKDLVLKLKQTAVRNVAADTKPFTSYELLAAHLWISACKARELGEGVKSKMIVAVDGRSRMRGLPDGYFGNVIFTSVMVADAAELVADGILGVAGRVRQYLRKLDDPYCRSALDFLEEVPDPKRFIKGAHTFASPNVGFTSWTQLPIYECDFGWGTACHAGPANIAFEGLAYVMTSPLASNAGGFRLIISLQRRHMPSFAKFFLQVSG